MIKPTLPKSFMASAVPTSPQYCEVKAEANTMEIQMWKKWASPAKRPNMETIRKGFDSLAILCFVGDRLKGKSIEEAEAGMRDVIDLRDRELRRIARA